MVTWKKLVIVAIGASADHDIDLTQDGASLDGETVPQRPEGTFATESGSPISPCLNGCSSSPHHQVVHSFVGEVVDLIDSH